MIGPDEPSTPKRARSTPGAQDPLTTVTNEVTHEATIVSKILPGSIGAAEWRKWPKVSPARTGAANTKRYRDVVILGRDGGTGPEMGMGGVRYDGSSLRMLAARLAKERPPYRASVGKCSGIAVVAYAVGSYGLSRVYQRFVIGAQTGTTRFYGEAWT